MTKIEGSDGGRVLARNPFALHTYAPCVCMHGCTYECVIWICECVHACNKRAECGKEREENRRSLRRVRILMSR